MARLDLQRIEPPSAVLNQIVVDAQQQAERIVALANEFALDRLSLAWQSSRDALGVGHRFVAELQRSAMASPSTTSPVMPKGLGVRLLRESERSLRRADEPRSAFPSPARGVRSTNVEADSARGPIVKVKAKPVNTTPRPSSGHRPAAVDGGRPRRAVGMARGARNFGIVLVLFCGYQACGTGVRESHSQQRLTAELAASLVVSKPPSGDLPVLEGAASALPAPPEATSPRPIALGEPFGVIKIPKIGLEKVIVEGTGAGQLREGPGRYQGTPRPGEPGNAAIAGHRTTYGAPFRDLDELVPGDEIVVTTQTGDHRYLVASLPSAVSPDADHVLGDQGENRLTLTTCHPEYRATERLIVTAKLVEPAPPPPSVPSEPESEGGPGGEDAGRLERVAPELVAAAETSAWATGAVWSSALMVLWPFFLRLRWRSRWLAWLLLAPPGLFVLANLFESINRLLPAGI